MRKDAFYLVRVLLKEFAQSYRVVLLVILLILNILFYLTLPGDYMAFIFSEAVLITLLWLSESVKSLERRIEVKRLLSPMELCKYYERQASSSSPFSEAYKVLLIKTSPPGYQCIPGIIEKIFAKPIVMKPKVSERKWVQFLIDLIQPYEDTYRKLFESMGWNEFKIRPIRIKDSNKITIIEVEPTTYYYSVITNFSCDLPLGRDKTLRDLLEPLILTGDLNKPLRAIEELKDLPISNHLGINVLIVTRDGDLLLSERSSFVAVEQYKIAHTLAGSLDWKTLAYLAYKKDKVYLEELIQQEIVEKEEISFPEPHDYTLYPIVLTRNLRFLGKPDIHLVGITSRATKEILEHTVVGKKAENIKIIRVKVSNETIHSNKISKCELLRLIAEKFANPILRGETISGEYLVLKKNRQIKSKLVKITYNKLSANLIIGLYAYLKAYQELCNQ